MTDKDTFRHVIGHFASGVTVLTTQNGGGLRGDGECGVIAVAGPADAAGLPESAQQDPGGDPRERPAGVNILDEDQGIVAERFASPQGRQVHRAEGDPRHR